MYNTVYYAGSQALLFFDLSNGMGKVPNCLANNENILACQWGSLNLQGLRDGSDLKFPSGEVFKRDHEPVDTGNANFTSFGYQVKSMKH